MKLANRTKCITPSKTLAIKARAEKMRKEGIYIIDLGAGEPDFDTPENIKEAGIKAIRDGFTKYTPPGGTIEMKRAVCEKLLRDNSLSYKESEVIVSCGAKHSLYNIALALFEEGDEVIIPSPYWVTYPEQIRLVNATPVFLDTKEDTDFNILPEALEEKITKRTKAVIVNTPSNPTGAIYDRKTLEWIAQIALKYDLLLISDECYEQIIYDGNVHYSLAGIDPEIRDKTLTVNAVSKTYSMTGWRIGYVAGPEHVIKAINSIQSHTTSNPVSISQKAAIEALKGDQSEIKKMVEAFQKRRDYIHGRLEKIKGISCFRPKGAFYCFPNCSGLFGTKFSNPTEITEFILAHARVAVVSGDSFGSNSHIRISYATSIELIKEAMDLMEKALGSL